MDTAVRVSIGALLGLLFGVVLGHLRQSWARGLIGAPSSLALGLSCAVIFAAAGARYERVAPAALVGSFLGVVLAAALVDVRRWTIPNRLVLPALGGCGLFIVAAETAGLGLDPVGAVLGATLFGGGLLGIAVVAPSAMGMGDVKLAALVGLVLGSIAVTRVGVAATTTVLSAGLLAGALLIGARKSTATPMPFGPFLFAGAVVGALVSF
jgi:leader peptidase (prepilin peptidase) / N-methyltransferase